MPFYLLLGAATGFFAGLFGIGGGLIIVPALAFLFEAQTGDALMHSAIGTSLATIIPTALSSIRAHHRHGAIAWPLARRLAPGIVLGTAAGAMLADQVDGETLRLIFAALMLAISLQMALGAMPEGHRALPGRTGMGAAGITIGAVSALIGIGGGTLTTPFLVWCRVGLRRAIATSAACGLPIALTGTLAYLIAGLDATGLPPGSSGYIHWPAAIAIAAASIFTAPLGARLTHSLPVTRLRRLFALLLILVAVRLLLT
ncbi:MAG: sulfite exporter TauE/SafE family protein [Gammaproteobacteria bacterium]|nr:sulfite exporter TauE/SafE family protein [Gammaproteobacteria bacterium]